MTSTTTMDAAIRVVVTPSQSSYFAGEPFSVTITFTNTRSPDSVPPRAVSHTHKRAAHSISSAPLARPPTSPGTPKAAVPSFSSLPRSNDDVPCRKNLIGKPVQYTDENTNGSKSQTRSMSVTIAPHELEEQLRRSVLQDAVLNSTTSLPLTRSPALPLAPNHPHARKQSLFDGQIQLHELGAQSHPSHSSPLSPSATTSTFSLSLDPISESSSTSPIPQTPIAPSPLIEGSSLTFPFSAPPTNSGTHSYPPQRPPRRPPQIGLGKPPLNTSTSNAPHVPPRTAFSSTFPQSNTELILYSYAQLTGTLHVTPLPGTSPTPDQTYALNYMRAALLKRAVVGGGSMDITSSLRQPTPSSSRPPHRRTHSRSSSISSGILSLFSPLSSTSTTSTSTSTPAFHPSLKSPNTPTHKGRTQSLIAGNFLPGSAPAEMTAFPKTVGLGIGIGNIAEEDIDPEAPLPTFEEQQSMLAVDLSLLPGESRSYTYTVLLPENLPPTYKGRTFKFSYELVIGTCRASGSSKSSGSGSISRVMKVPIRIYNHVSVGRISRPYDLLWPIGRRIKSPAESGAKVVEETGRQKRKVSGPNPSEVGTFQDLQRYSRQLLQSFPDKPGSANEGTHKYIVSSSEDDERWERGRMMHSTTENEGDLSGCREAVEILTRNPKKASYDVNKDGVKVAVLTFPKSSYRLGETVFGVVELNDRTGRSRVLKLCAMLEAQESLPSSISPPSTSRHLRRVHAEHYSAFVASTLRTTFALDIPSDASPAFQIDLGNDMRHDQQKKPCGGLEWKVRLCLLVAIASETSHTGTEGVRMKGMVRDGPRGEWGSSWRAPPNIAPMEKPDLVKLAHAQNGSGGNTNKVSNAPRSWAASLFSSILGSGEREYHDGDMEGVDDEYEDGYGYGYGGGEGAGVYDGIRPDRDGGVGVGVVYGGGEEGWKDVSVEMVECEVPIKVWPGNTAFKAVDVVFDV